MLRLAALLFALWPGAVLSAGVSECRLALVLAVDVSSSVDDREHALQRRGLAAALTDAGVAKAIIGGNGPVALAIFEWSGRYQQKMLQDWVLLRSRADLVSLAASILSQPRSFTEYPTAMGYALGFASGLLARAPACLRQTIDISGDGITNDGFRPQLAYRHFAFEGVTVNGLVVTGGDARIIPYYRQEVLHGPLAFLEQADGYAGFRDAMTRKLLRETDELVIGRVQID